ncbi:MAG: hypothetical protein OEX77_06600 [Candidatus Bathyarchaeota archaeon]|nr:hypothetical protein [Candidatus Bathyarchaeota archaeon]MDH5733528.1 hypothetical protein [Candidatus Bathyarchaeota archaeon]
MPQVDPESIEKYKKLSKRLKNSSLLLELRQLFERKYTLAELLEWLHDKVKWSKGQIIRHNDPIEILTYGKGRCGEFSILFTALCLAHDYRTRLILDMSDHVWTEIWNENQNRWVHVDPSEKRIDDPQMYERSWKKCLREVYAFENGNLENVTKRYKIATDSSNCQVNHRKKSNDSENYE